MARYLIFAEKANARSRTETIAASLGCGDDPDDVTTSWFGLIEHPADLPKSALVVPADEEHRLTTQERLELKDRTFMELQGWFA